MVTNCISEHACAGMEKMHVLAGSMNEEIMDFKSWATHMLLLLIVIKCLHKLNNLGGQKTKCSEYRGKSHGLINKTGVESYKMLYLLINNRLVIYDKLLVFQILIFRP